jgi:hypothetical protein
MIKWIAAILILIHVHHAMVMIMGEVLQMKVVAAAQSAGVPFFEEHGSNTDKADSGNDNEEALSLEDTDFSHFNGLCPLAALGLSPKGAPFIDMPDPEVCAMANDILTPPPQSALF